MCPAFRARHIGEIMTFVVGENCIKCKHTDCVEVCPVDAIYAEDELPEDQQQFLALNAELAQKWSNITEMKPALEDAEKWKNVTGKLQYLIKDQI